MKNFFIIMALVLIIMVTTKKSFPKKISKKGIELLKNVESVETKAYKDTGGRWTIGVGHLIDLDKEKDLIKKTLTFYEVNELLEKDLKRFEKVVSDNVKVRLTQNQFDALVIFAFNVGVEAFKRSTVLKLVNKNAPRNDIENALRQWNKETIEGVKVVNKGLVNRREKEIKHYFA